jgi:hypothetical protein
MNENDEMPDLAFEREARTPYSETYSIYEDGGLVGHIDLHFQGDTVAGTLCTTADANEDRIQYLIDAVDERLVMTAYPYREDFVVTVWRGSPAGVFSDDAGNGDDTPGSFRIGDIPSN